MLQCYIQHLEQVKDGWHLRFGGTSDDFWIMLSNFKLEQKQSNQHLCFFDPRLFDGKGGWFCHDTVLVRYANDFSNYTEKRAEAEKTYHDSGKAEQDRREKAEADRKEAEFMRTWKERMDRNQKRQERQWEEARRYQQQHEQYRPPTRSTGTALTIADALQLLELPSPATNLTAKQVKSAFHAKALKTHPDVGGNHEAMVQLNSAYQLILMYCQKAPVV